jgi:hypothetical protein
MDEIFIMENVKKEKSFVEIFALMGEFVKRLFV